MILEKTLEAFSETIEHHDKENREVSKSGVAWHIDHSIKVILVVCETLKKSDPKEYKSSFSFLKTFIFIIGRFPRGKVKAPKITSTEEKIEKSDLLNQLAIVRKELSEIEKLPKNSHFKHPVFGVLNLKEAIKFFKLHSNHHLKITKEIISSVR